MHSRQVAIVVGEYDPVIGCVAGTVGLELVGDCPLLTGHGRPRRWVAGRPPGAATGLLRARAGRACWSQPEPGGISWLPRPRPLPWSRGGASVNQARVVAGVNGGSRPWLCGLTDTACELELRQCTAGVVSIPLV